MASIQTTLCYTAGVTFMYVTGRLEAKHEVVGGGAAARDHVYSNNTMKGQIVKK